MNRPNVSTTSASTAIERMICEFDREEKKNRACRQKTENELDQLCGEVARLTQSLAEDVGRRRNFTQALNAFTLGD